MKASGALACGQLETGLPDWVLGFAGTGLCRCSRSVGSIGSFNGGLGTLVEHDNADAPVNRRKRVILVKVHARRDAHHAHNLHLLQSTGHQFAA